MSEFPIGNLDFPSDLACGRDEGLLEASELIRAELRKITPMQYPSRYNAMARLVIEIEKRRGKVWNQWPSYEDDASPTPETPPSESGE